MFWLLSLMACVTDEYSATEPPPVVPGPPVVGAAEGSLGCGRSSCLAELAPNVSCLQTCLTSYVLIGGSFERCMATECGATWPAARDCIAGVVDAGTCDSDLEACGITL